MSAKSLSKSSDVALRVEHVSKSFHLPTEQANGIKQAFVNRVKGIKGYTEQQVLKDISFTVEKGDFFGIVGRNGSGKSTLLKLISQIYTPNQGKITVNGKLVPFIELGVGFNPELTGRENIYLNGALLGFSHEEMSAMYEDIVKFAELEDFMDQKLKNYSSGMQVRLAFSIAIKADADILVLDEVLAVGDEAFQRKCFEYFAHLKKRKKTVILVTHSMDYVRQFCNKAALIDKGHKLEVGSPGEIAKIYRDLNKQELETATEPTPNTKQYNRGVEVIGACNITKSKISISVTIKSGYDIDDAVVTFIIMKSTGEWVYRWASYEKMTNLLRFNKHEEYTLDIDLDNIFCDGSFTAEFAIIPNDNHKDRHVQVDDVVKFEIISDGYVADRFWKPKENVRIINKAIR